MGTVALAGFTPEGIHNEIAAARQLTNKPLACSVLIPFLQLASQRPPPPHRSTR